MTSASQQIILAGVDEAGRGPLAGPVSAAAVILGNNYDWGALNDSKKLSEKKRDELAIVMKNLFQRLDVSRFECVVVDAQNTHVF